MSDHKAKSQAGDVPAVVSADAPATTVPAEPQVLEAGLKLEPVGVDKDGTIKPIADLSYAPAAPAAAVPVEADPLPPMDDNNTIMVKGVRQRMPGAHIWSWKKTHLVQATITHPETEGYQPITRRTPELAYNVDTSDEAAIHFAGVRKMIVVRDGNVPGKYSLVWPADVVLFEGDGPETLQDAQKLATFSAGELGKELEVAVALNGKFVMIRSGSRQPMTVKEKAQ